jgi:hypothetical protein
MVLWIKKSIKKIKVTALDSRLKNPLKKKMKIELYKSSKTKDKFKSKNILKIILNFLLKK